MSIAAPKLPKPLPSDVRQTKLKAVKHPAKFEDVKKARGWRDAIVNTHDGEDNATTADLYYQQVMLSHLEIPAVSVLQEILAISKDRASKMKDTASKMDKNFEELRGDIASMHEELKTLKTDFGQWSIGPTQMYNCDNVTGSNFQKIAFPDGTWPKDDDWKEINAYDAIKKLDRTRVEKWLGLYGLEVPSRLGDQRQLLSQHLGVPNRFGNE